MKAKDVGYSIFSGLLLASLFPPFQFEILAWVALVPLLWALEGKKANEAFMLGLLAGLISFGIIIWWVKISMTTYGGLPAVLAWLITVVLAVYLALYPALFAYFMVRMQAGGSIFTFLVAAPLWVSLELLRAYALSGFPWALLGYSQYRYLHVIQIADLAGVYGVSFAVVFVNAAIWHFFRFPQKATYAVVISASLLTAVVWGYGYLRLHEVPIQTGGAARPVGIVQGNVDQAVKWSPRWRKGILEKMGKLTRDLSGRFPKNGLAAPPIVVWPEAAAPLVYQRQAHGRRYLRQVARDTNSYLLFGALGERDVRQGPGLTNSAYLLNPGGEEIGRYDKMHLLPFGEYVPLGKLLFFVKKLVPVIGTFKQGDEPKIFDAAGAKFGVLICFEAIFPRVVRRMKGAQFLINITNDAWFGKTAASEQHLSMVAFRAVEFRMPIVRSANTGISALIDSTGAIRKRSPLFEEWIHSDAVLLKKDAPSAYARMGDMFAYLCVFVSVAGVLLFRSRRGSRMWYDN